MQHFSSSHVKLMIYITFDTIHQFFADSKTIIVKFGALQYLFRVKTAVYLCWFSYQKNPNTDNKIQHLKSVDLKTYENTSSIDLLLAVFEPELALNL